MGRKPCCRRIAGHPASRHFTPNVQASGPAIVLALDEFEALRLADVEGLYHADAATRMEVSRATFGRIVSEARRKVATALLQGQKLLIDGGHVRLGRSQQYRCHRCHHNLEGEDCAPNGPVRCPRCLPVDGG